MGAMMVFCKTAWLMSLFGLQRSDDDRPYSVGFIDDELSHARCHFEAPEQEERCIVLFDALLDAQQTQNKEMQRK